MERLTYDFCFNGVHCNQIKGADNLECAEVCEREGSCKECPIARAFDRLAAIEDILGDDYDLDHLRELVEADKAGRYVKTKGFENRGDIVTGGIVYYADEETMEVQKGQISSVKTKNGNVETFLVNFPNFACSEEFHVSEWNDFVFRYYAEAKGALEKMKEAPHD